MKKISLALFAIAVSLVTGYGQATQVKVTPKKQVVEQTTNTKVAPGTDTRNAGSKKITVIPQTKTTSRATITKKDGTPDKRFKANKVAKLSPEVVLKKDGTPDKRFKASAKKP